MVMYYACPNQYKVLEFVSSLNLSQLDSSEESDNRSFSCDQSLRGDAQESL
jgi:hypothetical protein